MPVWVSEINNFNDSLPTAKQWLTTATLEMLPVLKPVKLIWLPNKFLSYTVETESFRIRLSEEHMLYPIFETYLESWIEEGAVLALSFTTDRKPQLQLETMDSETCTWEELGKQGFKAVRFAAKRKPIEPKTPTKKAAKVTTATSEPQEGASAE